MSRWLLTISALADMREIYSYGEEAWGGRQARWYAEYLYERFDGLARFPGMGRHRPELRDQLRSIPYGSHVVFYMQWTDRVVIARVLHGAMDFDELFEDYDPLADLPA